MPEQGPRQLTYLEQSVHCAVLVLDAFRTFVRWMTSGLADPLAVDDKLELVASRFENQSRHPVAVGVLIHRCGLRPPVVECASEENRLRIRRMTDEVNPPSLRSCFGHSENPPSFSIVLSWVSMKSEHFAAAGAG